MKKYYKILNEKECHNGLQFKTGLNIDSVPFDPNGSCLPGGIYYAQKDILAFLYFGLWIREVKIPKDAQVYKDLNSVPEKWKADRIILGRKYRLTAKRIQKLIDEGANVNAGNDSAIRSASEEGKLEVVKLLLENDADIHALDDYPLRFASLNGHSEVVKFLLENGADIHAYNDYPIRFASLNGHSEVVKLLLENGADVHAQNDQALRCASEFGYFEVVELLLENGANVHALDDYALRFARANGHLEVVELLENWDSV